MDTNVEETFEGLTPKEFAISALMGVVVLVGVIATIKSIKQIRKVIKADEHLWNIDPTFIPKTEK